MGQDDEDSAEVPLLDLKPRLDRPLSLLNPLDYLRVLYWVFFFPQALTWYIETFGVASPEADSSPGWARQMGRARQFLGTPTPQRDLYFHALLLTVFVPVIIAFALQSTGLPVDWSGVAFGVAGGVALVVALGVAFGVALGAAEGVALGVVLGVAGGVALGVALGVAGGMAGVVARGVAEAVALGVALCVAGGVVGVVALGAAEVVAEVVALGAALGVAGGVAILRLPAFMLAILGIGKPTNGRGNWSRVTPLPLPGFQRQLAAWLRHDPGRGVRNLNEVLRFSLQFMPAVGAANDWLAKLPETWLLGSVELLASRPYDWDLVRYGSASLLNELRDVLASRLLPVRRRRGRPERRGADLRMDTPARAACAGYWALHALEGEKAVEAFVVIRSLPGGEQLYRAVAALFQAMLCGDMVAIAAWSDETAWLERASVEASESTVVALARQLRDVALEAAVARDSVSRLNRNAALSRAGAVLTHLLEDLEQSRPQLVWPIAREIATQWRDALSKAAGVIGQQAITKPVRNPFVVGDPVTGELFVGREDVMRRLEELWGSDLSVQAPSVVLYGHRRMGKTSILQNLGKRFGRDAIIVLFTMQRVGRVEATWELLIAMALEIYDSLVDSGIRGIAEPREPAFVENPYRAFNRFLSQARRAVGERRVILTIDEFEEIERGIAERRIEVELLAYLRGVLHQERWLVLAFAGLHTLEEMAGDYWNPLYGGVNPIRVGFLSSGEAADLLANPSDDFPLDFTRETAKHIYDWVHGQPYLTQLVGHALVTRYNRQVFEAGQPRESRFTIEDIDVVVESDEFYEMGNAYFTGVWGQAGDAKISGQHEILIVLARTDEPLATKATIIGAGLTGEAGATAIETLIRHDVVLRDEEDRLDFTVPLMRRWIRANKTNGEQRKQDALK